MDTATQVEDREALVERLTDIARDLRVTDIEMLTKAGSGHPGGTLSASDMVAALYFHRLRLRPEEPHWPDRDRFVLSKGHCIPIVYAALAKLGFFPEEQLWTLRKFGSPLQGHPDRIRCPGIEAATGSLGQGLSMAVGMAIAGKMDASSWRVYCMLGDGESQAGQLWEAAMLGGRHGLSNLCVILDQNQVQQSDKVVNILDIDPVVAKWRDFGWHVREIDGHDMAQVLDALDEAEMVQDRGSVIVSHTVKGHGVSWMELNPDWHGKAPNEQQAAIAIAELKGEIDAEESTRRFEALEGEQVMGKATREAFGEALVEVGHDPKHVVLDGDLMKSNFTYLFKEAYPERFVECGIAESNMVGVAAGLALSGKVAWASSFSCFIAGRLETVRMSVGYNEANVRIAGTHAGIGIGDDGASQMALEDVAAMRALPNMAVIQPCDAAETVAAVKYLADEHVGPAFLRLTRQKLDDVNGDGYAFEFGKVVTLREGSDVCLFGSGATVQEALRAADELSGEGISASVVNVHTLAPLDAEGVVAATLAAGGKAVSVEDHNVNGGLGSAVAEALAQAGAGTRLTILGCRDYGQSGSAEELYDAYGISAKHVAEAARALTKA